MFTRFTNLIFCSSTESPFACKDENLLKLVISRCQGCLQALNLRREAMFLFLTSWLGYRHGAHEDINVGYVDHADARTSAPSPVSTPSLSERSISRHSLSRSHLFVKGRSLMQDAVKLRMRTKSLRINWLLKKETKISVVRPAAFLLQFEQKTIGQISFLHHHLLRTSVLLIHYC